MTTVENHQPLPATADDDDHYHSDDVGLRDTPPLKPMKVNLEPSPSPPPAVPLPQVSPESSPGPPNNRKGSNRSKNRPSQGDAVLVSFMDGGKRPEIARQAGQSPLASDDEQDDSSMKGTDVDLAAIASAAIALPNEDQTPKDTPESAQAVSPTKGDAPGTGARERGVDAMEDVKPTTPSITATLVGDPRQRSSPETIIKSEIKPEGELPPIRQHSPKSGLSSGNGNSSITLPSISVQLGDINHLGGESAQPGDSTFSQSPPARALPRFPAIGHGSPPKSPNDVFRRELPSPGGRGPGHFYPSYANSHRRPSQADTTYASAGDYSSSNTETPSTDQSGSTPANMIDRMSIDGITNPQIGGFQCTYPGCTAQPFQTQVSISLISAKLPLTLMSF
jgi:hypothetical protein